MNAAIIPYQHAAGLQPLRYLTADFLMPVAGKPLAEHLVEYCVSSGISTILLLVDDDPGAVERYFGSGERWGAVITVQAVDAEVPLVTQLASIFSALAGPICCFPANMLVTGDFAAIAAHAMADPLPIVPGTAGDAAFCVVDGTVMHKAVQACGNADYYGLLEFLRGSATQQPDCAGIQCRLLTSLDEYLAAQRALLDESWPGARILAARREQGIWIGDHVTLDQQITLIPPLLIGHHSTVSGTGTIGPNAVIAPFCLINNTDLIEESVLLPGTATGPHTELSHLVVLGSRIVNARSGVCVTAPDAFILGDLQDSGQGQPVPASWYRWWVLAAALTALVWFFFVRR